MYNAIQVQEKHAREDAITAVKTEVISNIMKKKKQTDETLKQVREILDKMVKDEVRRLITEDKIRPDGRKVD